MFRRLKTILPNSSKRSVKRLYRNIIDSFAYKFSKTSTSLQCRRHIIFVCKGNVCRSPFAEHYLANLNHKNCREIKIESCGLDTDQGTVSPPDAILAAENFGINLISHRSKSIIACNLENAELILAMEFEHYQRLKKDFPRYISKMHLLNEFAPFPDKLLCNIYDPFGLGVNEFIRCFKKMKKALDSLWTLFEANKDISADKS